MNIRLKFNQLLLPQSCLLCAHPDGGLLGICAPCFSELPWHQQSQCLQCALPSYESQLCGSCLKSPPAFDATKAVFQYAFPINAMLQRYKYQQLLSLSELLGQLLTMRVGEASKPDLLLPMPLHKDRLHERGYNQSLEIARNVATLTGVPLHAQACRRIRATPPQTSLPLKQRVRNMKGAFACDVDLSGKRIAIIDDVMTTGASLQALAETLKQAGAAHVECWVIARTLPR